MNKVVQKEYGPYVGKMSDECKNVVTALEVITSFIKHVDKKIDELVMESNYIDHLQLGSRMAEVEERVDKIDGVKDHPQGSRIDWELSTLKEKITALEKRLDDKKADDSWEE